ncbi:DUF4404 family protein [Atopomonas sediminilitoris]|uniref:DUF4404 family protein n=1 Tax=Atopomonas sediminilitoris TaxID=2919919 RepID=UPI001F4D36CF|nr:DUF4404 family protein [Atopomonas sediminilitoris]MCJ8168058.1 DUF4404 family protein [Atopomonas sediminilitoris]
MPRKTLQQQLDTLRQQLAEPAQLSDDDRHALLELAKDIERFSEQDEATMPDDNLVDGVNLAVERFEAEFPALTGTLRNVLQALASMGI